MLVKYGSVIVGYSVLAFPVFGPKSAEYLKRIGNNPANITRDYIRNSFLLINSYNINGRCFRRLRNGKIQKNDVGSSIIKVSTHRNRYEKR